MSEEKKIAEPISFEYEGTPYTMEFSKHSVKIAENSFGITVKSFDDPKATMIPDLFYCSLLKNHPKIKRSTADAMFELMVDKQGLFLALYELYLSPMNAILADPDDEGKAIRWKK